MPVALCVPGADSGTPCAHEALAAAPRILDMEEIDVFTFFGRLPEWEDALAVFSRLIAAVILGAVIGVQRELVGKPAGLRTHALVALAASVFTIVPLEAGMDLDGVSRVIQGVATGIGFIGAGVILKRHDEGEVLGLTTAASIWAATAVGVGIGLGHVVLSALAVALTLVVLATLSLVDRWVGRRRTH
jgi:putative Mg2+ transporter-C (MgtC) family protein